MVHVQKFDSFEEAMAAIGAATDTAKERTSEAQWKLADGKEHNFLRLVAFGPHDIILIAGQIFDVDELGAKNKIKYADQYEEGEWEYEQDSLRTRLTDGFVFTCSYSPIEPEGELGDVHVSTMREITARQFVIAREFGFDLQRIKEAARAEMEAGQEGPAMNLAHEVVAWIKEVSYQ